MLGKHLFYLFLLLVLISYSCKKNKENQSLKFNFRPNILWICCEDISPDLGCYGNDIVSTPNIDKLASEGILFTNAYTTAGVCAPSRSSIITGIYPTSLGTNAMRNIEIDAPTFVKGFVHYIREKGYYCVNNNKEDYNLGNRLDIWHESSSTAHWEKRPQGKPFFAVFNDVITHEHKIWAKPWDFEFIRSNEVNVPPYYPNVKAVRHDIARNYSNIMELDAHVGFFIKELEEQNLLDSTIIVFYSDHGGPLPRQKREIYDSGIKVPLIIRFPNLYKKGTKNQQMVSLMDLGPTMLNILGIEIPDYMSGIPFMGEGKKVRKYIYAARDRTDNEFDKVRAVRNKRYKYIFNYRPDLPNYQNINYRFQMPMMQELLKLEEEGRLNEVQKRWFNKEKHVEEFYDTQKDPHELDNLINNKRYVKKIASMRNVFFHWSDTTMDVNIIPESEILKIQKTENITIYEFIRLNPQYLSLIRKMAIKSTRPDKNKESLVTGLSNPINSIRYWALIGIGNVSKENRYLADSLNKFLYDPSAIVQYAAARALCEYGLTKKGIPVLLNLLNDPVWQIQLRTVNYLGTLGADSNILLPYLEKILEESDNRNNYVIRGTKNAVKLIEENQLNN